MPLLTFWCKSDTDGIRQTIKSTMPLLVPKVDWRVIDYFPGKLVSPDLDEIVVVMGTDPFDELKFGGVVPKNRALTGQRGKVFPRVVKNAAEETIGVGYWMVTYAPGLIHMEADKKGQIIWDIRLAHRYLTTQTLEPPLGIYTYSPTLKPVLEHIRASHEATGKLVQVSLDLETMGLYPWYPDKEIVTVQVSVAEGEAQVTWMQDPEFTDKDKSEFICDLGKLLQDPRVAVVGANLKFDLVWLREKLGLICTNFRFDTTIVGSLLDENRSNSLNWHAKEMTPMGGYDDCVHPFTRLLKADLTWVYAKDVKPGDELVGFDEKSEFKCRRKLMVAVVKTTKRLKKPCLEIHISTGQIVVCSDDHGFLGSKAAIGSIQWYHAYALKVGDRIKLVAPFARRENTYAAGWMGGFLDGEGYCAKTGKSTGSFCLGWSQKEGPIHDHAVSLMARFGAGYVREQSDTGVLTTKFTQWPALHAMMLFRPERLVAKRAWIGASIPQEPEQGRITKIVPRAVQEVVSITTSCHTFVAEGLASHNSFNAAVTDKSHMEVAIKKDPEGFLQYAGGDTDACFRVCNHEKEELKNWPKLSRLYTRVIHPAVRAFESIEHRGLVIDLDRMQELELELMTEIASLEKIAFSILPGRIKAKYSDDLSLGRGGIIAAYLFSPMGLNLKPLMMTEKSGEASTAKNHLMMYADHKEAGPFIKVYAEWVKCNKFLGTYVRGFLNHLRPDMRFHPTYMFYAGKMFDSEQEDQTAGTVTGRLSAKEPAVQCAVGETMVLTDHGEKRLDWLVENRGAGLKVLTHTGAWRDIIGVYKNGFQPVFKVATRSGKAIVCTGNHPILTPEGWVRTDQLEVGDNCYVRASNQDVYQSDILLLDRNEKSLLQSDIEGLEELRGSGDCSVRQVGVIRSISGGYGRETGAGLVDRAQRREWRLRPGKLHLGYAQDANVEQAEHQAAYPSGSNEDRGSVGSGRWDFPRAVALSFGRSEVAHGRSVEPNEKAESSCFEKDRIVSITPLGRRETFDLTIDACHSFVADGFVVHNTIPKHDKKWAPKLRRCFVAPEGYVYWSADYSQGELRLTACVANEERMIEAYNAGMDLHCVTGAGFAHYEYDDFLKLEKCGDPLLEEIFKTYRQRAKSANFGLLYGMGAEGYRIYARAAYGVVLSIEEAQTAWDSFFALYPGLTAWHTEYKTMALVDGYVETPMGRVRHLPLIRSKNWKAKGEAERQAINCLSDDTEMLTAQGWKKVDAIVVGELAPSVDPVTGVIEMCPVEEINQGEVDGRMWSLEHNAISALATPNHRWLVHRRRRAGKGIGGARMLTSEQISPHGDDKIWVASEGLHSPATSWSDDAVELLGWVLTDGHYKKQISPTGKDWGANRVGVTQSKPAYLGEINALFGRLGKHSYQHRKTGQNVWEITCLEAQRIREELPDKTLTADVMLAMSHAQRQLLFLTMLKGDGCWDTQAGRFRKFVAGSLDRTDAFLMLCALIGQPARAVERDFSGYTPKKYPSMNNVPKPGKCWLVELVVNSLAQPQYGSKWVQWVGRVWCPTLKHGTWIAKRNGKVFVTGNSPIQGCLSDMNVWAASILETQYGGEKELWIAGATHDNIYGYCPEDKQDVYLPRVVEVMETLPLKKEFNFQHQIDFPADLEVGPSMGECAKVKLAA